MTRAQLHAERDQLIAGADPGPRTLRRLRVIDADLAYLDGGCAGCGEQAIGAAARLCVSCSARLCRDCFADGGRCPPCTTRHEGADEPDPDRAWDARVDQ